MTDEDVRDRVADLLARGLVGDAAVAGARVLEPIPVAHLADALHSWFVPVAAGDTLAGFAELRPDLELIRYSAFPQRLQLNEWTDPETLRLQAERASRPGETLGEPVLTYDREPSRLAWAVTGQTRAAAPACSTLPATTSTRPRPSRARTSSEADPGRELARGAGAPTAASAALQSARGAEEARSTVPSRRCPRAIEGRDGC